MNSTLRRLRDLRVLPIILQDLPKAFQASQLQDLPRAFQTSQSFMTFSLSRKYFIHPGIPPYYSILQLECIFCTSTGFHRNSTEYQLRHYILQAFILQRKRDVALSVEMEKHSRIEFKHPSILSSKSTNYKNDIS